MNRTKKIPIGLAKYFQPGLLMLLYYFVDGEGFWGVKFTKRKKKIKQIPWNAREKLGTQVFGG